MLGDTAEEALDRADALRRFVIKTFDKHGSEPMADAATFKQFQKLFPRGKSCPKCKSRQMWHMANSIGEWRQANINNNLEVDVGEATVLPMDADATEESMADALALFTTREIYKTNASLETLAYWHLRKAENLNILYIENVTEQRPGVFSIEEEQFAGVPLSNLLVAGISENTFQDIILQLCDGLEFLHGCEPGIAHNAVFPENILIGKGNLLKLAHFDEATVGGSPAGDIVMVGEFMQSIDAKYIAKYGEIIDKCVNAEYKTIDKLRQDFVSQTTKSPIWLIILPAIMFALVLILRQVL